MATRIPTRATSHLTLNFIQHPRLHWALLSLIHDPPLTPTDRYHKAKRVIGDHLLALPVLHIVATTCNPTLPPHPRQPILEAEVYKEHIQETYGKEKEALRVSAQRQSPRLSQRNKDSLAQGGIQTRSLILFTRIHHNPFLLRM